MTADASGETHRVGIDFGTLSGRAVVVRVNDGAEVGSAVHEYAHGVADRTLPATGERLPPDWALQISEDWRRALSEAVPAAVRDVGVDPPDVVGIATDFTACTALPTTRDNTPLCESPDLEDRPQAYPKLWKHHAAQSDIRAASAAMGKVDKAVYVPDEDRARAYDALYEQYTVLHDVLGRESRVLHRMREIRNAVVEA